METSLIVAIVAALASGAAAALAFKSANQARKSADDINGLNHQIAVIDRHAEELRSTYREVVDAMSRVGNTPASLMVPISALELLIVCRAADSAIRDHAENLQQMFTRKQVEGIDAAITGLRDAYSACQTALDERRAELLARAPG